GRLHADHSARSCVPPCAAHQPAVTADHGDDLRAVRPDYDGAGFAADGLGLDVTRTIAEAIEIVAADVLLPARVADDDAVRLVVDRAAALDDLAPLAVHVGDGRAGHGDSDDARNDCQRARG